jgi:hypothetical protein
MWFHDAKIFGSHPPTNIYMNGAQNIPRLNESRHKIIFIWAQT